MTDPNRDKPEVVHHTTINNPPTRSGGNGGMAFIIGAIVVVLAIVAYVVWSGGAGVPDAADTNVDVNIDVPAPKMPELPAVEPPTIPTPTWGDVTFWTALEPVVVPAQSQAVDHG